MAGKSNKRTLTEGDEQFDDVESDISECKGSQEDSEHDTRSEQSEDEEGSGGLKRPSVRTTAHNLARKFPGTIGEAKKLDKNSNEENEILQCTNKKIQSVQSRWSEDMRYLVREMDIVELKATLGLCYLSGEFKSGHETATSLFASDGTVTDVFRAIMCLKRCLLSVMTFDNALGREIRRENDPLAAILASFTVGSYVYIDEMLVGFRGNCKFRMYMAIMTLADAQTNYFYNSYMYAGQDSDGLKLDEETKQFSKPTQAVLRLSAPLFGSNRNITANNWFTSVEVVQILKNSKGLTYVGTLGKNKREIPSQFQASRTRTEGSSLYGYTKDSTLLSHAPKRNKCVMLISSMHHNAETNEDSGKPDIIEFYNSTKGGFDSLDQKCACYSIGRRTRRWPMAIFYAMLDIAGVNSFIIHTYMHPQNCEKKSSFFF
ncbi:hypothetical protein PR048_031498 [Dryococelus australis]|uniref:PiggyBac transposable element-derived protein domain-containing protein n=1 Tax=Dryococelus australis TaxID=614101 RepID=A0ABQ9G5G3_9NEOP|nr:hypothetical protein PR048_031498 [Dryococelus australis]